MAWLRELVLIVFFILATSSDARIHPAYLQEPGHCNNNETDLQPRWMAKLPDNRPLSLLSIPGTHDSLALYGGPTWQCQTMSLATQLQAGIRALDVRCRHVGGRFQIYHAYVNQRIDFGQVLEICATFLKENPSETILMRIKKEWISEGNNDTFEETFVRYLKEAGELFWLPDVGVDDMGSVTLGQVRGKVVVLQDFTTGSIFSRATTAHTHYGPQWSDIVLQDDYQVITIWSLYAKWLAIKRHLTLTSASLNTPSLRPRYYVNYLSASVGVKPYFAASGHRAPGTAGDREYFGLINSGSPYLYEDFPRERCLLGGRFCVVEFEGMNILTYEWLKQKSYRFVGIVFADFPGCGLIQAIIAVNENL